MPFISERNFLETNGKRILFLFQKIVFALCISRKAPIQFLFFTFSRKNLTKNKIRQSNLMCSRREFHLRLPRIIFPDFSFLKVYCRFQGCIDQSFYFGDFLLQFKAILKQI